jgi:hypothetical protein
MDRSLYPEGVEVHQQDLERTETTKAEQLKQRLLDSASMGVVSGGAILPNGILVKVGPFTGYTPSSEYITWVNTQSYALADYALNAINYVLAIYTEQDTVYEPHETNGNSYPTNAARDVRIRVLSSAEYAALPVTDDNLNNDALDRALLLATVKAGGTGVNILSSNITQSSDFGGAVVATNTTGNITGVSIISAEKTTQTGAGTLVLTVVGAVKTVTWQSPADLAPGSGVNISASGTYFVFSGNSIQYLKLSVIASSLPGASATDTIQITNIYAQTIYRFTPEDAQHRTMIGTGVPSAINPHGLSTTDIGVDIMFNTHQRILHNNGILPGSSAGFLQCIVNTSGADSLNIGVPVSGDRYYDGGIEHNDVGTGAGESLPRVLSFLSLDPTQILFDIFITSSVSGVGIPLKRERARYDVPLSTLSNKVQLRDIDPNTASGAASLSYNDSNKTLSYKAPGDSTFGLTVPVPTSGSPKVIRLWSGNNSNYVDVYVNINLSGVGNILANLTVSSTYTGIDVATHMKIATVMWYNDELGNGYPIFGNNLVKDQRTYGMLCAGNLRDDLGVWGFGYPGVGLSGTQHNWVEEKDVPADRIGRPTCTMRNVGIGTLAPWKYAKVHVVAGLDQVGIIGDARNSTNSSGVIGYGNGSSAAGVEAHGTGGAVGVVADSDVGHGLTVSGQVSGPVSSALAITPQSADPTIASAGDAYINADGRLRIHDGSRFIRYIGNVFTQIITSNTVGGTTSETDFNQKFTIKANTLGAGSVLRISGILDAVCSVGGSMIIRIRPPNTGFSTLNLEVTVPVTWVGPSPTLQRTYVSFSAVLIVRAAGVSAAANGWITAIQNPTAYPHMSDGITTSSSINTTIDNEFKVTVQPSISSITSILFGLVADVS